MDRTTLNIVSIVAGGAGLFVVLTKVNVPELNMTFLGANPFAIKRDAIEGVMTWIFTLLTLAGAVLQLAGEIWRKRFPSGTRSSRFYAVVTVGAVLITTLVVLSLTFLGNRFARRSWQPTVVHEMNDAYEQARFVVEHDGWRADQLDGRQTIADPEPYRRANIESAERSVVEIEQLLELPTVPMDLRLRLQRLQQYFNLP